MRLRLSALVIACVLPAGGCCSLARLFCGPDRTPWVSVDYSTPELAVRTLLEAIRRDEPEIVYLSLSGRYRQELNVDQMTMLLAWQKLREANPWLHVAGYAEVPPAHRTGDTAEVNLDIEGTPCVVRLRRERREELRWTRADGTTAAPGRVVTSFAGAVTCVADEDDHTLVTLAPMRLPGSPANGVPIDEIISAGVVALWRIDKLSAIPLDQGPGQPAGGS
jgi:hypothetical protein